MEKVSDIDVISSEEMHKFIKGLFNNKMPQVDKSLDLRIPSFSAVKDQDVEIVSMTEVKNFIEGLFEKE